MIKILFQGDSITDAGRGREVKEPNTELGWGYVSKLANRLLCEGNFEVYNRGISADRVGNLYARWHRDTLNIDFDILSILVGVNDVGFLLREGHGPSDAEFEFIYDHMISMVKEEKPDAKIVLCQPFILEIDYNYGGTLGNDIYRNYLTWLDHVSRKGEAVKRVAEKHGALFVPMFERLKAEMEKRPVSDFTDDGVHPNSGGAEVIADEWLRTVKGAGWL